MTKIRPPLIRNWFNYRSILVKQIRLPLVANSFYLLAGRFGSTGLLFIFWVLAARYIPPEAIGLVIAANSAMVILTILSDLGLSSGIIRFAAAESEKGADIVNASIAVVWISSLLMSLVFLIGISLWSPGLQSLRSDKLLAGGFVIFTVVTSLLNMQMSAILSKRRADFIFWRSIVASALSIPLLLVFVRNLPGFRAAFLSYNIPTLLIFLVSSIFLLPKFFLGFQIFGRFNISIAQQLIRYAGANYIATLLWEIPTFALPLIAASAISAEAAAYFYMPWVIGISILAIPQLVSISLFAEGSYDVTALFSLVVKAGLLIAMIVAPIIIILWFWGDILLGIIGSNYVNLELLRLILISIVPYSINMIFIVYLRVNVLLKELIALCALMSITVLGLASTLSPIMGSNGLAIGWLLGQTVTSAAILAYYVIRRIHKSGEK